MNETLGHYDQKAINIVENAAAARNGQAKHSEEEQGKKTLPSSAAEIEARNRIDAIHRSVDQRENVIFDASVREFEVKKKFQEVEDILNESNNSLEENDQKDASGSEGRRRDRFVFVPAISRKGSGGGGDGGSPALKEKNKNRARQKLTLKVRGSRR
jgi:hypothetical protein